MQQRLSKKGKMELRKEMGGRLRDLRKGHGFTVDELSRQLDMTPSFLGLIERGQRGLSAEWLISICTLFQCSADFLLTGKEKAAPKVPTGNSKSAVAIDLLLNEHSKQKLAEFLKSVSAQQKS
ncbi:MAG: helix-turn-helix domain-containing protein [Defluviitaleaceae bacterium]|nr:helix-turn-helix domain-containing protein [Defluviitaleaceae bacterium]